MRQIAPYLDVLLDDADVFVDAFVGGASVALDVAKRYPRVRLVLNDKDPGIAALWSVVAGLVPGVDVLKQRIRETVPTVALRDDLKARHASPTAPVDHAFETLFVNRTSYSGNLTGGPLGGRHQMGKTKIGSRWNPKRLCQEIDRVHALLAGRCEVLCDDAADVLGRPVGQDRVVQYADPPYLKVGNSLYREGMTLDDHARLALRLRGLPNWVLSYDDAPEVHALYDGWTVAMPLAARYSVAKANGTRTLRQELLILPPSHPLASVDAAVATRRAS